MKIVLVAGATGLVGGHLIEALETHGFGIRILSRSGNSSGTPVPSRVYPWTALAEALDGVDAVINLAGENIGAQRWTPERQRVLRESRLASTQRIVQAIRLLPERPELLLNASAVGIYESRGEALVDEDGAVGAGFLADLCRDWEVAAQGVIPLGLRLVSLRMGVVLAREGGALPRMSLPIRRFVGCRLGSGRQGFSWIHIHDLVALILATLSNRAYEGPVNATAPFPISQGEFIQELARQLHRPLWPLPARLTSLALKVGLGQMAQEMLLQGALVRPQKALSLGFTFRYPDAAMALADLIRPVHP